MAIAAPPIKGMAICIKILQSGHERQLVLIGLDLVGKLIKIAGNITLVDKILKIVAHIKTSLFPAGVKVTCNIRRRKV